MSEPYKYQPDSPHVASSIQTHDDPYRNTRTQPPTADRDDLAAILAKHRTLRPSGLFNGVVCRCKERPPMDVPDGWRYHEDDIPDEICAWHTTHVAQMVLESDWLRERDAVKWDEGEKTSDCVCGHNIFAHPKDDWRSCRVAKRGECDCTGFEPATNPYRADRADAPDNTTNRTHTINK